MKKTILYFVMFCIMLTLAQSAKSQEDIKGNVFYSELGGPGVLFSIHFDGRFKSGERLGWGYRVGAGFAVGQFDGNYNDYGYYDSTTRSYYSIPVGINYVLGKKNSANTLEVGGSVTFLTRKATLFYYDVETPGHFIGNFTFMYRRAPINGGFLFRVGFTPVIGTSGDLLPMGAVGFGYAF